MINCYVIDDEKDAILVLEKYILKHPELKLIGSSNAIEAVEIINQGNIDLVFLDMRMSGMSGLEFLKVVSLRPYIVFTTAYSEYAQSAFDEEIVYYLLKPIKYQDFEKAVTRVKQKMINGFSLLNKSPNVDHIYIQTGVKGKLKKIQYAEVRFVFKMGVEVKVVLEGNFEPVFTYYSLKDFSKIPNSPLFQVHQSYVINIDKIDVVEKGFITLKGDTQQIPIGETYREEFMSIIRGRQLQP